MMLSQQILLAHPYNATQPGLPRPSSAGQTLEKVKTQRRAPLSTHLQCNSQCPRSMHPPAACGARTQCSWCSAIRGHHLGPPNELPVARWRCGDAARYGQGSRWRITIPTKFPVTLGRGQHNRPSPPGTPVSLAGSRGTTCPGSPSKQRRRSAAGVASLVALPCDVAWTVPTCNKVLSLAVCGGVWGLLGLGVARAHARTLVGCCGQNKRTRAYLPTPSW
jgi:hypothetical protein